MRNIVEERFDAGVRFGENIDKDMIAVRIGPDWQLVAVASPDYVNRHGLPGDAARPRQSRLHQPEADHSWRPVRVEVSRDGRELRVRVNGQLTFNSTPPYG